MYVQNKVVIKIVLLEQIMDELVLKATFILFLIIWSVNGASKLK